MSLPPVLRSLTRARGICLAVVATLALGVGGLTTAFGLADAALLRQPPFEDAQRLAMLYITRTSPRDPALRERWSFQRIQLLRQLGTSFGGVANYSTAEVTLTGTGDPEPVSGEIVSPSYFPVLGVSALRGRPFVASDDDWPNAHPIVLLGYDLWQRRFAGDGEAAIIGRTIGINGVPLTVVGVLPRGFHGLTGKAQVWIPTTMAPSLTYADYLSTNQNFISVVARLRPGVDFVRADAEMRVLGARIDKALPSTEADSGETVRATAMPLNIARVDDSTRRSLLVLLAAVALLHLLACANVASLLLGRATSQRREAAVRAALGCGSKRLLVHFLAEGFVLAAAGGSGGLLLAMWASTVVEVPTDFWGPRNFHGSLAAFAEPAFGWRVVAFGAALTAATALLIAWAPAASMLRMDILANLRDGARGATGGAGTLRRPSARGATGGAGTLRRPSARGAIVALEAALAMMLLVGGGLMIESFVRMRRTSLGIDPEHVLTFALRPSEVRVPVSAAPAFISRVLGAISGVPGVIAASVDGGAPVSGSASSVLYVVGRPAPRPEDAPPVLRHYVAPGHFRALGVPLRRGRIFTGKDVAGQPRVAIISESAARRFWPNDDPIGQRVWFGGGSNFDRPDSSAEIVGIVGDVAYQPLDHHPFQADFYTPYAQFTYAWRIVFVRTAGDPAAAVPAIRRAVHTVDPDLPLSEVQTMTDRIGSSWSRHRFDAFLFGGFAALALLLATSGIYAVVAYAVSQRTREMGIRLALGAQPGAVVRLVIREGLAFPLVGLVTGIAAALALTRLLSASLYKVTPTDPIVFAGTVAVLLFVSVLACLVPARRATRVDPLVALRAD